MSRNIVDIRELDLTGLEQLPKLIAGLFRFAGLQDEQIRELLYGREELATSTDACVQAAAQRIRLAAERGEKVFIGGDYDADGICATAIMKDTLDRMHITNGYYIPDRLKEGYGINTATVELAHRKGYQLIITVDNGVKAFAALQRAKDLGMDVILTDHHRMATAPAADILVHPDVMSEVYETLSGAGVALQISRNLLGNQDTHTALACIAAIGDVMPLWKETRVIVRQGLQILKKNGLPAVSALFRRDSARDVQAVAFEVVPKLNSLGRMSDIANVNTAVPFLLLRDPAAAARYAAQLETVNRRRRDLSAVMYEQASGMVQDEQIPVIYDDRFHEGICGLVAGRLAEEMQRPVLVLAEHGDELKGSGRSVPGFDLFAFFSAYERFTAFGGHEQAVGIGIRRDDLPDLKQMIMHQLGADVIVPQTGERSAIAVRPEDITFEELMFLESLQPLPKELSSVSFALQHPEITSVFRGRGVIRYSIGTGRDRLDAVAFTRQHLKDTDTPVLLTGRLSLNRWKGNITRQMELDDIE